MSGPGSISLQPSLEGVLRQHRDRLRAIELGAPGIWVYVLNGSNTVAPATTPPDFFIYTGAPPASPQLNPYFVNGWGNVAGNQAVSFRIHPATRIAMRGAITGGTIPSIVFVLPPGYRPSYAHPLTFPSSDGASVFTGRVDPDGSVWVLGQVS